MRSRKKLTRRAALSGMALAVGSGFLKQTSGAAAAQPRPPARDPLAAIPISGQAGPGLKPFDAAMRTIIDRHGLPGAALAITKDGRLVLAKGYGWANVAAGEPVRPDTLFGLASLSKPITAVATLKLVEQGKLRLDDRVFSILKINPPAGARVDPRLRTITVRHCLNHSGGWDRSVRGDPINWEPQICRALRLRPPLSPQQFLSFVVTMPLDFAPGTDQKYSNVGYIILGEVVAAVAGQAYQRFVADEVLRPMGITRLEVHRRDGRYLAGEAIRHLTGSLIPLPPMLLPMVDATGGWSASVVDMARFVTNLEGSRGPAVLNEKTRRLMIEPPPPPLKVRPNGTFVGLGWDSVNVQGKAYTVFKDGSYQGMRTFMKRLPTGVCWCLFYNASMDFDPVDMQIAGNTVQEVRRLVEGIDQYPKVDLFKEYP
jgi:CubicO group peptidase (beta-lactamase class C family)